MRRDTQNWIVGSEYEFGNARAMFEAGRYPYVVFFCHLALEKMLKAHVTEVTQSAPAKTHNLMYLVRKAGLQVPPEALDFLGEASNGSVPARYPDDMQKLLADTTREVAERWLRSTEEALEWLRNHENLKG